MMVVVHSALRHDFVLRRSESARTVVGHERSALPRALSRQQPQHRDPAQHVAEQRPGQVTPGEQQPVVARMFDEPSPGLYQALLQAGQRPVVHRRRQHQPPPQIPEVVRRLQQRQGGERSYLRGVHTALL